MVLLLAILDVASRLVKAYTLRDDHLLCCPHERVSVLTAKRLPITANDWNISRLLGIASKA